MPALEPTVERIIIGMVGRYQFTSESVNDAYTTGYRLGLLSSIADVFYSALRTPGKDGIMELVNQLMMERQIQDKLVELMSKHSEAALIVCEITVFIQAAIESELENA
jgi:hypothetical protein